MTRHKEKVMPKVFSAWGEYIQTAKMSGNLRVRNQKDNVLKSVSSFPTHALSLPVRLRRS